MKIIPAVDIIAGKTVRLEQGEYDRKLSYDVSPVEAARKWEAAGAELIHVVDLDGAKQGHPVNLDVIEEIVKSVNVPVEVGGGFRKELDIKSGLDKGIWRIVVGSRALEDIDFARTCIETFKNRLIVSVDAADYKPRVRGWEQATDMDLFEVMKRYVSFGSKELIYTDIKRDGTLSGPNIETLKRILKEVGAQIISAGGVKNVDHVKELKKLEPIGLSGVIVGRALYDGTIDLKEAINAGKADNPVS
jgi:phosphoribosylformimino-5-aminoimidazole carboxamide ribotide isomerase